MHVGNTLRAELAKRSVAIVQLKRLRKIRGIAAFGYAHMVLRVADRRHNKQSAAQRAFVRDRIQKIVEANDVRQLRAPRTRRPDEPARAPFYALGPELIWSGR